MGKQLPHGERDIQLGGFQSSYFKPARTLSNSPIEVGTAQVGIWPVS
jgi:hypothetical protein